MRCSNSNSNCFATKPLEQKFRSTLRGPNEQDRQYVVQSHQASDNDEFDVSRGASIYATPMRTPNQRRKTQAVSEHDERQRINIVISSPNRYQRVTNRATANMRSMAKSNNYSSKIDFGANDQCSRSRYEQCFSPVSSIDDSCSSNRGTKVFHRVNGEFYLDDSQRFDCEADGSKVVTQRHRHHRNQTRTSHPIRPRSPQADRNRSRRDQKSSQGQVISLDSVARRDGEKLRSDTMTQGCSNCAVGGNKDQVSKSASKKMDLIQKSPKVSVEAQSLSESNPKVPKLPISEVNQDAKPGLAGSEPSEKDVKTMNTLGCPLNAQK